MGIVLKKENRLPIPLNANVSRVMSANRSSNTKPEQFVRQKLLALGLTGYRLNWRKAPGKPDVAYVKRKIAVFVNGCFWHGCARCSTRIPTHNAEFWSQKFERNRKRDKSNVRKLKSLGWKTFVIRECEIKSGAIEKILQRIHRAHTDSTSDV